MKERIINAPTPDILVMSRRRMPRKFRSRLDLIHIDVIGLLILPVPDFYFYADVASKGANMVISKIFDSCPQHATILVIFGEVAAAHGAMRIIEEDDDQF